MSRISYRYTAVEDGRFVRLATTAEDRVVFESTVGDVGRYVIQREGFSELFFKNLPSLLADWLEIALFVYLADRASLRRSKRRPDYPDQWERSIQLRIPVREPAVWNRSRVDETLRGLLGWLTEDDWKFEFVRKAPGGSPPEQAYLFEWLGQRPSRVALFSGGLDSFAGAVHDLAALPDHHHVFVTGRTSGRQQHLQAKQIAGLKAAFPVALTHLTVPYGIRARADGQAEERSQRTRGFVHLSLGAVTARLCGLTTLHLTENGIGAINLPYHAGQLGTANSRGVHPVTLHKMVAFIASLLETPFTIDNRGLWATKGELCATPALAKVQHLIAETFTCDGFPNRVAGKSQCGRCTSCLLRRQSLAHAGLVDPDDDYVTNWRDPLHASRLAALRAMTAQTHRLVALHHEGTSALIEAFPSLLECSEVLAARVPGGQPEALRRISSLYQRYVAEWRRFTALAPEPVPVLAV